MDFVHDTLAGGRKFRTLNIVDVYTRECRAIEVDTSLGGQRVVRVLEMLRDEHGVPERIMMDNGPEFTGKALDAWAYSQKVELDFIRPGKPMEHRYDAIGLIEPMEIPFRLSLSLQRGKTKHALTP